MEIPRGEKFNLGNFKNPVPPQLFVPEVTETPLQGTIQRLTDQVAFLAKEVTRLQGELSSAKGAKERLESQNEDLSQANRQLRQDVGHWQNRADSAERQLRQRVANPQDPQGHYRRLGIDPSLARSLPADKLERLITLAYRAYTHVFHPDVGGDTRAMQDLNASYEFLRNARRRANYGR